MKVTAIVTSVIVLGILGVTGTPAQAGSMSVSSTAPTVDAADIAQLVGTANPGGDEGHIWSNRPVQGQTFTTGSGTAYTLGAITLKNLNNNTTSGNFTVRVGTISGNTFTPVASESMGTATYVSNNYITATFAAPVSLARNTLYGFDWGVDGDGFVTVNNLDDSVYTGGTAYSSGANSVPNDANLLSRNLDRVFHLDMTAVPTPALEYTFDDVTGSTVPNHGHLGAAGDATLEPGTTVTTAGEAYSKSSGRLVIDQGGDKMSTPDIDSLDSLNEFTVSFFVNATSSLSDWKDMMGDCDSAPSNQIAGWNFMAMADGRSRVRLWDTNKTSIGNFDTAGGQVVQDEWHHIAAVARHLTEAGTRDVTVDFYRDGQYVSTATVSTNKILGEDAEGFKIGNAMWDSELMAEYGNVAFFDTALSDEQVAAYYASQIPEPATCMLAALGGLVLAARRRRRM